MTVIDQAIRETALDPTQSFIVQAPAGSGKTELLTQRFLILLGRAQTPEEIIAITFTRKAAAEMRARIVDALQKCHQQIPVTSEHAQKTQQLAQQVLNRDQEKKWFLLENPSRLRIMTIDSLCASLTRSMPIVSRFGAPPTISDDVQTLYQKTAQEILASLEQNTEWSSSLCKLLLHLDNNQKEVENLLSDMLARRDQWLPYIFGNQEPHKLRQILESSLQDTNIDTLVKLDDLFPAELLTELLSLAQYAANNLQLSNNSHLLVQQEKYFHLSEWLALTEQLQQLANEESAHIRKAIIHQSVYAIEQLKQLWLALSEILLTKDDTCKWRKQVDARGGFPAPSSTKDPTEKELFETRKKSCIELLNHLNQHDFSETLLNLFSDLRALPPLHYQDQQWQILLALLELLPILVAHLQLQFQQKGVVDYIEVAQGALLALGDSENPTDIALRLDYQIQHILVDEFQDTAITQFRLIEQLIAGWQTNDGRTLFLVGDPMQSIYRFRKAEVGLFLQAQQFGIGNIHLTPLVLQVNFRSDGNLVNWFNQTFSAILPQQADITASAISYTPSVAIKETYAHEAVFFYTLTQESQHEAETIVAIIKKLLQETNDETITILVRARNHLLEILPILQQAQIDYRAVEIATLNSKTVIQDLLALTRALLHPADRIAWLAILRAPWCGLSLADIHSLTAQHPHLTIWECLEKRAHCELSSHAQQSLDRLFSIIALSLRERRRQTLSTWIKGTWYALGGPAVLKESSDLQDANAYFELLDKLSIHGDIDNFQLLEKQLNSLYASSNNQTITRVEVMTMHKSKGLEFDHVILPGLTHSFAAEKKHLMLSLERATTQGGTDLLLAPVKSSREANDVIYDYMAREEKKRADYEITRLLYVAATRAKKSLHLIADLSKPNDNNTDKKLTPTKNSLLGKLWPALEENFLAATNSDASTLHESLDLGSASLRSWAGMTVDHTVVIPAKAGIQDVIQNNSSAHRDDDKHNSKQQLLKRLATNWQLPTIENNEHIKFLPRTSTLRGYNNVFVWHKNTSRMIGNAVHYFLQHMPIDHDKQTIPCDAVIANLIKQLGHLDGELTSSIQQVKRALEKIFTDPRGRWILSSHKQAVSEYALMSIIDGAREQIIIDRTFIDENDVRWIIDYKITDYHGDFLEDFLASEMNAHRAQLEQYAKIMYNLEKRDIRLGLYFPLLTEWREWKYEI